MAKGLLGIRIFAGGCDLTGANNKIDWSSEVEEKETTTWADVDAAGKPWKTLLGGLGSSKVSGSGFWEAGDLSKVDDSAWANQGGVGALTLGATQAAAVGDLAYLTQALQGKYSLFGSPGDVAPWSADWSGSWPMVRGQIMHPPGTARTTTGTGTARQLGAVAAGKGLYACLHVLSVAGTAVPTLTVTIEADNAVGFASPVTVGTFTAATAISGQAITCSGFGTDDWFRAKWTISGTNPSFLFVVSLGIQ